MKEKTTLIFTGDIGFDHYMEDRFKDENFLSPAITEYLKSADHVITNVEGALSLGEKNASANAVVSLLHSMNPEVATFLQNINSDIWNLANNHIMDAGPKGMEDTLRIAKKSNALTIGAGMNISEASTPIYLKEAGGIGMFGVGYQRGCRKATDEVPGSFSWSDMERIEKTIKEIKSKCRYCIVVAHGGEEFTSLPSPYTRKRYMDYLSMGADIVVSHHPHVPMNYETFENGKAIFYSLGNFVFDTDYQRRQFNTEKGIFLKIVLDKEHFEFEGFGIKINREKETIEEAPLPLIFENVQADDYELLEPLSAKAFLEATKKQQIYLFPRKYNENTTDEEWHANFYEPLRSGRVPNEALDFQIIVPIAEQASWGAWKKSRLENVKRYILDQL